MSNKKLKICENCKFYFFFPAFTDKDLFGNERKKPATSYCKWFGKKIKKKNPACGVFKLRGG